MIRSTQRRGEGAHAPGPEGLRRAGRPRSKDLRNHCGYSLVFSCRFSVAFSPRLQSPTGPCRSTSPASWTPRSPRSRSCSRRGRIPCQSSGRNGGSPLALRPYFFLGCSKALEQIRVSGVRKRRRAGAHGEPDPAQVQWGRETGDAEERAQSGTPLKAAVKTECSLKVAHRKRNKTVGIAVGKDDGFVSCPLFVSTPFSMLRSPLAAPGLLRVGPALLSVCLRLPCKGFSYYFTVQRFVLPLYRKEICQRAACHEPKPRSLPAERPHRSHYTS